MYVANLDPNVKAEDIESYFKVFGPMRLTSNIKQRENKNFVFVTFDRFEDAKEAMNKSAGVEFFGRKMYVDWSGRFDKEGKDRPFKKEFDKPKDGDSSKGVSKTYEKKGKHRRDKSNDRDQSDSSDKKDYKKGDNKSSRFVKPVGRIRYKDKSIS